MARKTGRRLEFREKALVLTATARIDLAELHFWIRDHESLAAADAVTDMLQQTAETWARIGYAGRPRDDLMPGLRSAARKGFSFYYIIRGDEMRMLHIVRGARDVRKLDFSDAD